MVPVVMVSHHEKHDPKHRYKPVEMQVYLFNDIIIFAKETKDVNTSERFYWQLCLTWFDDKCMSIAHACTHASTLALCVGLVAVFRV